MRSGIVGKGHPGTIAESLPNNPELPTNELMRVSTESFLDMDRRRRQPNETPRVHTTKTRSHNSGAGKFCPFNLVFSNQIKVKTELGITTTKSSYRPMDYQTSHAIARMSPLPPAHPRANKGRLNSRYSYTPGIYPSCV